MSDYIPHPDTEMHINQMPEECLRILFSQLPFKEQFEAGDVCRLWRTVRDALFRTQKSLVIEIDKYAYTYESGDLEITDLNEERTASLVAMFPSLTQLTIFTNNQNLFEEPSSVAHLLVQYRDQLDTLKLVSGGYSGYNTRTPTGDVLFDAINAMSNLKRLALYFDFGLFGNLDPFDMPILSRLDKFDFGCRQMPATIVRRWAPHLEARSTPMEISFPGTRFGTHSPNVSALYESITPKVGSMFTQFPTILCNLHQFQRLATCFTNLIELKLDDRGGDHMPYSSSVPELMQALANLKQLATLSIITRYDPRADGQPGDDRQLRPQLPAVKKWHLTLCAEDAPEEIYLHDHLSPWTTNLDCLPNLEDLSIILGEYERCADCGFKIIVKYAGDVDAFEEECEAMKAQAKDCLRHQLSLIKQQFPKLSKASMEYDNMHYGKRECPVRAKCTLKDISN